MSSTVSSRPYIGDDGKTDAETYFEAVLDGSIVACNRIIKLAKRILPEMRNGYRIWRYDPDYALKPVRFIEKFCKLGEGKKAGQPFILEPYERAIIETAFGFVDEDGHRRFQEVLVQIGRKNGKGLTISTQLPTPNGWRTMGDLHVGDQVFGQDGKPSTIIAESEIFDKPTYLVTFEDDTRIKATCDHIWTVCSSANESWTDMTTDELIDVIDDVEWYVPLCKPVEYPDANLPVSPRDMGLSCVRTGKPIPDIYMTASISQREELFDTLVGECCHRYFSIDPRYIEFIHDNKELVDQFRELASSLGISFESLSTPNRPCIYTPGDNVKEIVSIERIPNEPTKCIAIDNPSHLYLAGRQYTATHNTELCAALNIYMLMKAGERGAEIYNVATTTEQASLCMGKTEAMIKANDLLDSRIRKGKIAKRKVIGLNYDATNSYLCTLSAKGSTKDGLNPFFAVMDELGACRDHGEMYDQITEALGAREEPMVFIISTENRVRQNIWDERKKYATDWLDGTIEDDRLLAFMYELDDRSEIFDEECWIKANPGIDVVKSRQFIRDRLNKCSQSPERMPSLLTKDFNLVANQYTSYLTYEECSPNLTYVPNPNTDRYCIIGFDLAERNDLNAAVAIFRRPGEDFIYEKAMFWLAEEQLGLENSNQKQRDGVPYLKWQSDGLIRIMQGSKINQRVVVDWIKELYEEGLYPMAIAFDKWHVDDWTLRELEGMVGSKNLHPVQPWAKEISQAMKEHKIDLHTDSINDNDNSILHWCRGNVQARTDDSNNVWPLKKGLKPENRIDGYMAEIYAYIAYKKHEESYLSMIGEDPKRVMSLGSQEVVISQ